MNEVEGFMNTPIIRLSEDEADRLLKALKNPPVPRKLLERARERRGVIQSSASKQ